MVRRLVWLGAAVVGFLIAGRVVISHLRGHSKPLLSTSAPLVKVVTGREGTLTQFMSVSGKILAATTSSLTIPASGTLTVDVTIGQTVAAGQILASVSSPQLASNVKTAAANLSAAESKLALASAPLTPSQQKAYADAVSAAQDQVASAEAALALAKSSTGPETTAVNSARQSLAFLESSQSPQSVAVANAQAALTAAENQLSQAESGNTATSIQSAQAAVASAQAALASAQAQYQSAKLSATAAVNSAEAALTSSLNTLSANVTAAQDLLTKAQDAQSAANSPPGGSTLTALQNGVTAAKTALQAADQALAAATLRAPFSGTVTAILQTSGATVGPTEPILSLTSHAAQFVASISPSQTHALHTGEVAHIRQGASSWNVSITALVSSSANPSLTDLIVNLPHGVVPLNQPAWADAKVRTAHGTLVPVTALGYQNSTAFVDVVRAGHIHPVTVQVRLTAHGEAVLSGLSPGARVVPSAPASWQPGESVTISGGAS